MMWKIDKPNLRRACGKDIDELVMHCQNLDDTIKPTLKKLYQDYDAQGGTATDAQLATIPAGKESVIHSQYAKTYDGNTLSYVRTELMDGVFKCPYCSINQPTTLDHYMPESQYKALAVCRLNLVPMCGTCNNLKSTKPFANFVHCYYQAYPAAEPFLKAKVYALKKRFVVKLYIDDAVLADPTLITKIHYQIEKLHIFQNIMKESSVFVTTMCKDFDCSDNAGMVAWLNRELTKNVDLYGFNDWRCAINRGMLEYPKLDIAIFQYNKANPPIKVR